MNRTLLTHYELVKIARKNRIGVSSASLLIADRIAESERKEQKNAEIELSARFRMLENIAAGNAIIRAAKVYTK
jgi:hypothetical protein